MFVFSAFPPLIFSIIKLVSPENLSENDAPHDNTARFRQGSIWMRRVTFWRPVKRPVQWVYQYLLPGSMRRSDYVLPETGLPRQQSLDAVIALSNLPESGGTANNAVFLAVTPLTFDSNQNNPFRTNDRMRPMSSGGLSGTERFSPCGDFHWPLHQLSRRLTIRGRQSSAGVSDGVNAAVFQAFSDRLMIPPGF